jgi:hypothetical protein
MPKNLPAQFVCQCPKVLNFNEKRLHWASVVREPSYGNKVTVLILHSSLPKFRKGILALIRCKELNTLDFQTDSPIQTQKKFEAQQVDTIQYFLCELGIKPPMQI